MARCTPIATRRSDVPEANAESEEFRVSPLGHETPELLAAAAASLARGAARDAEALYRTALIRQPWEPEIRYRLASAQIALGKSDEALFTLAEARDQHTRLVLQAHAPDALAPDAQPTRLLELAQAFYRQNQMATASSLFQRLVEANPDVASLRSSLGLSLQHQGRIEEAVAAFEALQRRWPHPQHHSLLHYVLAFQRSTPDAMYQEGLRWARLHAAPLAKRPPRPLARRDGKLRIGYFSPLFNQHQLTKFFRPAIEHHDRTRFSLVCYSGAPPSDETGHAIRAHVDLWREVAAFDDDAFVRQIEEDEVDILVDLWGHTAGNRLSVFARKPAPIAVSWLNYIETTGLSAFDYVLHADGYVQPGAQALYSETILPIGPVVAPFRQTSDMPPAGETPMLQSGHMTFGCFGHPAKLTLEVIRVWARILAAVPNASLVLRSGYFEDPVLQRTIQAQFAGFGIGPERIEFPAFATGAAFLATYRTVDLILDPFPYQGLTTTLDAVSAGVPVLTWEGRYMHVRIGAVTLRACGLEDELVTASEDGYVERAIALAGDPHRLNRLRARVRSGFEASAYRDEAAFTRRLEAAYEQMASAYV
jgi:predicted O-linked N-acetylglucosamine transferase (SPINDLY family)